MKSISTIDMKIVVNMRPVIAYGNVKGLFHLFDHNGDALIEFDDGEVKPVGLINFHFTDSKEVIEEIHERQIKDRT